MDPVAYLNSNRRSSASEKQSELDRCRDILAYAEDELDDCSSRSFTVGSSSLSETSSDWNFDIDDILVSSPPAFRRRSDGMLTRKQISPKGVANRRVTFGQVQIRVCERILGDSIPASSSSSADCGPSLSLGWAFTNEKAVDLNEYETKRSTQRRSSSSSSSSALLLSPEKREKIAKKAGFSKKDIEENIKLTSKTQRRRSRTIKEVEKEEMAQLIQQSRQKCLNRFLQVKGDRGSSNALKNNTTAIATSNSSVNSMRRI
jgi:hypothetical protein